MVACEVGSWWLVQDDAWVYVDDVALLVVCFKGSQASVGCPECGCDGGVGGGGDGVDDDGGRVVGLVG